MPAGTLSRRMTAEDAWFLYFEKPAAPLHIGSVGIYEGDVPFDKFYASMDSRMHLIPRYRQRAVIPPFYAGHPTWEDDPKFSLTRHLSEIRVDPPGTMEQVRDLCADYFASMLPRDRPLWDMLVIHGIDGDRSAIVSRVHHCLVDGVSGIELLLAVVDMVPDPEPTPPPAEPWQPKAPPNPVESWTEAVFEQWNQGLRQLTDWQQRWLDPRGQMREMTDLTRAFQVAMTTSVRQRVRTPWNKSIGGRRTMAWTEMSFQEVRGIRSALGGTVNDVMLTILGGALGRYLEAHNTETAGASVRIMIPVNVRKEDEKGALGNRVSMMLPEIPVGIADPAERLVAVREQMERLKAGNQASAFESLTRLSSNLPAVYHALAGMGGVPSSSVNLVCTNVPGPMIPLFCVGHRLIGHYPMVPLAGDLGIGAGITSFDKGLFLGVMGDPEIVPDIDLIGQACDAEFKALRAAAKVPVSDLPDIRVPPSRNGKSEARKRAPRPAAAPVPVS